MIQVKLVSVLLCVFLTLFTEANATVESVATPAGHRFLFAKMENANRVAVQVAWPSSWLKEKGRNPAVPYLGVELMARSGAGDMDASELMEKFRDLNASARVWVTSDHVRAVLNVNDEDLDAALTVVRSVLALPRFDERWLVRIRDGMYGRWKQFGAQLENRGWNAVRRAVLGTQPINAAISLSDVEALKEVTRDDLLAWHARTIVARGAHIVVAGNLSRRDAVRAVDWVFGSLPTGTQEPMIPIEADFAPRTILLHVPDAETPMIGFVGRLPVRSHGGEYEDLISIRVLGAGTRSRIFDSIRTKLRASYAFGAGQASYARDLRVLSIWGEVDADKLARSRETFLETYRRFREDGPTAKEVEDIKAELRAATRTNLVKPGVVAFVVLEAVLDGTDAQRVDNLESELDSTTVQTIRERLQHAYPAPEDLIQVIVTADANAVEGACVVRTIAEVDECRPVN